MEYQVGCDYMGTTFIEDELLKRSSSGILTPMRDGDVIQSSVLAMTTSSDPALNAAVSTAIIDEFGGVIITLTGGGNAQTLQSPTSSTAGKSFTVVSDDGNGVHTIEVNGITLSASEAQRFIWDGSAWVATNAVDADDITLTPVGDIVATDVQAGIAELDDEKMKRITSVDNEIARYDSTGGDVQGYSSNAPTASDTGNVVVTGGLDNTPIGQTTPAAAAFTTIQSDMVVPETKTSTYLIETSDFGKSLRMNTAGDATFTFPSVGVAQDGARITLSKVGTGKLTLQMVDSDKIFDSSATCSMYNDTTETYATVELEYCDTTTTWNVRGASGTWVTT